MKHPKFCDPHSNAPVDLATDGCELNQWAELYGKCSFARHPEGFLVFLSPAKLLASDEYLDSDPYTVERNLEGSFHRRRIDTTVELAQRALSHWQGGTRILDLACGQGHITAEIKKAFQNSEVAGLDYSISAIFYAHKRFTGIEFTVGDAYATPYASEQFDLVVLNNIWEHVPDPLALLAEVSRILKPSGSVIVSTPSRYRLGNLFRVLRGQAVTFLSKHHVTEYSVGQVKEQLAYGGFEVREISSKFIKRNLVGSLLRFVFSRLLSFIGSHHSVEGTVFYLARKV